MKRESKTEILNGIYAIIALVIIIGFYVWIRFFATFPQREVTVVDCELVNGTNYYEVTVMDKDGELWSYYSDQYTEIGVISVLFDDNDRIIDVR